jgi:hypothetical protein
MLDSKTVVLDDGVQTQFSEKAATAKIVVLRNSKFNPGSDQTMSSRVANIVVTCTKRKSVSVENCLQLGGFTGKTVDGLATQWIRRLNETSAESLPADDLYSGDHWQIAQSLKTVADCQRVEVRLWVCSAGYGLIPSWAPVKPYSATFSTHHKDSVLRQLAPLGTDGLQEWWCKLANWQGPTPGEPRTLCDLAREAKRSPLIFVASDVYLRAVAIDLEKARSSLVDPRLLTIVSAGGSPNDALRSNFLPCNARLQPLLGGALMSLNIRVVRRILSHVKQWPLRCDDLTAEFQELIDAQPEFEQPQRKPMTDENVLQFVRRHLAQNPLLCASPLLRQLRQSGWACEQKRFGKLFHQVRKQFHE